VNNNSISFDAIRQAKDPSLLPSGLGEISVVKFLFLLALYFCLHMVLRVVSSPALELDEAEQIVLSQWLLPSYGSHPPLYTWLQFFFTKIVGTNVLAVSLLKNILLFLAYMFIFLATRRLTNSSALAAISSLSLLFIPQISWGAQRDLTHSVLLLASASAFFYVTLRLLESHTLHDYIFFGIATGLGILSKHNFSIFAAALIIACVSSSSTRSPFLHPYILLSILIAGVMVTPYLRWASAHPLVAVFGTHKFHMASIKAVPGALLRFCLHIIAILAPLLVVYGVFFRQGFTIKRKVEHKKGNQVLLTRFFLALFGILIFLIVAFHVTKFKNRWLAPLLILVPIYFTTRLEPEVIEAYRAKHFFIAPTAVATLIILFMTVRIFGPTLTGFVTDLHYPSRAVAQEIRTTRFEQGTIVADRQVTAGNLKIQFPRSLVLSPSLKRLGNLRPQLKHPIVILWENDNKHTIPRKLKNYMENVLHISSQAKILTYKRLPMYLYPDRYIRIGIAFLE